MRARLSGVITGGASAAAESAPAGGGEESGGPQRGELRFFAALGAITAGGIVSKGSIMSPKRPRSRSSLVDESTTGV